MHICPAEIAAALIALDQATITYWYLKMRVQGFSDALRACISALKSTT